MKNVLVFLFLSGCTLVVSTIAGCTAPGEQAPITDRPASPSDLLESRAFAEKATEALGEGRAAGYEAFMDSAVSRRPHQAAFVFHAGRSKLAVGDTAAAIPWFERLVAMGMTRSLEGDAVLLGAADTPWFAALRDGLAANAEPMGETRLVGSMGTPDMVPESVAWDPVGQRWFVGSVREGVILEASMQGERVFASGLPSVMGMVFHDGRLIVAVSRTPHLATETDMPTGVLILDGTDGSVRAHHGTPGGPAEPGEELDAWIGDVHVTPAGVIYATDSVRNVVYEVPGGSGPLQVVLESEWFNSLQGMAQVDGDAGLFIADYTAGLLRADMATGDVIRLATPANATLLGMDGLDGWGPGLVAIQNGTSPQRVIQLRLNDTRTAVIDVRTLAANIAEFREPTLGVRAGDDYVFVANSFWPHLGSGPDLDPDTPRTRPTLLAVTPDRF